MRKKLPIKLLLVFLLLGISCSKLQAQFTVSTGIPSPASSGSGGSPAYLAFAIENSNSYAINFTGLDMYRSGTSNGILYSLYYSSTSITGSPGAIPTSAAWTLIDTATQSAVSTTAIHPSFTNLTFQIPPNTIYRFAVVLTGGNQVNMGSNTATPTSFTNNGVSIYTGSYQISGATVGYWSGNANYYWAGTIYVAQATPCVTPPIAGTATVSNSTPCSNSTVKLNSTGGTVGIGQTYQWQTSTSATGPFTNIGSSQASAPYILTTAPTASTNYYRYFVECSSMADTSSVVSITTPTLFPGGTYTINSASPTGGSNFNSFTDAANAIKCGITSAITLNVAPNSGPYNEQVLFPATIGSNATNTLTINGNGNTLSFNPTAVAPYVIGIEGTDNVTIRDLNVEAGNVTTAYVCRVWNGSSNDSFINCNFKLPLTVTSSTAMPFASGGTSVSAPMTAGPANHNNVLLDCFLEGGYYSAVFYGNTTARDTNNQLINCRLKDFYLYGLYDYYQYGMVALRDTIERPSRPTISTFYGMFLSTGNIGLQLENNVIRDMFNTNPINSNTAYGIYLTSDGTAAKPHSIINNLISGFRGNGTHYGMYLSGVDYVNVYHNTIVMDDISSTGATTYGIYNTGTLGGINIKNNNVYINRGGVTGTKYCLYYTGAGAKSSDYNNLFMVSGTNNYIGYNSANQSTLAAWQLASGAGSPFDANSYDLDPFFMNPIINNFSPTNSSLDDKGTPVSVFNDINGLTRSATTPDIGAYEFAVPPCSGTPNPGTITGPDSVCFGKTFTLSANNLTIGTGIIYDWQYNNGAGWTSASVSSFSYTVTGGITVPTDFRIVTYCTNSLMADTSNVYTQQLMPFYYCYCSPYVGNTIHTSTANYLTNVTIPGTTLNNSTTAVGAGGYTQTNPSNSSQTGTVDIGSPFVLTTTQSTTLATAEAWVDWDHSGTFDVSEYYPLTSSGITATASITPPMSALLGLTGMRIRISYSSPNVFYDTGACFNATAGRETEDYIITVAPAPTCPKSTLLSSMGGPTTATLSWTPISGAQQWQVEYGAGSPALGSGTRTSVTLLPFTTPTLTYDTSFLFYVRDICGPTDSSTWTSATKFYLTPPNDDCINAISLLNGVTVIGTTGGATQSEIPCDASATANDVWYKFTTGAVGGSVTITVTTAYADAVIQALDGTCGVFLPMTPTASTTLGTNGCIDGPAAGTEFGTYTVLANTTYYFRVYGYGPTGGITKEGTFTIVASGTPLVIKLNNISATNKGTANRIDWNSLSEELGDTYELERSLDAKSFESLAIVAAKGKASSYSYLDEAAAIGANYYRLKMTDKAGHIEYSKTVMALVNDSRFDVHAYPNPVADYLTVKISNSQNRLGQLMLTDVTGKMIFVKATQQDETIIDMKGMAKGVYLLKYTDDVNTKTIRINKQ